MIFFQLIMVNCIFYKNTWRESKPKLNTNAATRYHCFVVSVFFYTYATLLRDIRLSCRSKLKLLSNKCSSLIKHVFSLNTLRKLYIFTISFILFLCFAMTLKVKFEGNKLDCLRLAANLCVWSCKPLTQYISMYNISIYTKGNCYRLRKRKRCLSTI